MGQHSLTNLYPVLHHLGLPLKYVCVTSERKARLIERKYPGVKATTSLDDVLNDEDIKGIFVSAAPASHFSIASQVLKSGKSLFIEKPPCQSLSELDALIRLQRLHGSPVGMVGLQKRYAPAVRLLNKRLGRERLINYDLHYLTGAYPEGDALLDLYIHPLDLVCHLFGPPEIIALQEATANSYLLMLRHPHIVGTLELSTAYTWTAAEESLKVCTHSSVYNLSQMEQLTFSLQSSSLFGVPCEKIRPRCTTTQYLYTRNNFSPVLANNQVYSQGYFHEVAAFVEAVEGRASKVLTSLPSVRDVYRLISTIQNKMHQ